MNTIFEQQQQEEEAGTAAAPAVAPASSSGARRVETTACEMRRQDGETAKPCKPQAEEADVDSTSSTLDLSMSWSERIEAAQDKSVSFAVSVDAEQKTKELACAVDCKWPMVAGSSATASLSRKKMAQAKAILSSHSPAAGTSCDMDDKTEKPKAKEYGDDVVSTSSTQASTVSDLESRGASQDKSVSIAVSVGDGQKAKELACAEEHEDSRDADSSIPPSLSREDQEAAKARAHSKRPAAGTWSDVEEARTWSDVEEVKKPKAKEPDVDSLSTSSRSHGLRRQQRAQQGDSHAKQQLGTLDSSRLPGAYAAAPGKRAQRVRSIRYNDSADTPSKRKPPPPRSTTDTSCGIPPPTTPINTRAVTTGATPTTSAEASEREFLELRMRAISLATSSESTSLSEQQELISKVQLEDQHFDMVEEHEDEENASCCNDATSTTATDEEELLRGSTSSRISVLTDLADDEEEHDNDGEERDEENQLEENQLESFRTSQLPVAAEVYLSSLDDVEGDLRELVRQEILESCSVAVSVSSSSNYLSDFGSLMDDEEKEWRGNLKNCCFGTFVILLIGAVTTFVILTVRPRGGTISTNDINQGYNNMTMTDSPMTAQPVWQPIEYDDNTIIATIPDTICYERAPLMGSSQLCPPQPLGSAVTNLVAESRLWSVPYANISILNAGEVQADMARGDLTIGMAKGVLPFANNTLVTLQLEGFQVATVLERSIQKLFEDSLLQQSINRTFTASSYPYGAGIRFDVDMTKPFPSRVSNLQVLGADQAWARLVLQGVPYTVVTNSYLAHGGDGYHEFNDMDSAATTQKHDTGLHSLEEFIAYCQHEDILLNPPEQHYSTQSYIPDPNLLY